MFESWRKLLSYQARSMSIALRKLWIAHVLPVKIPQMHLLQRIAPKLA
jgi:hypothetical protein